MEEIRAYLNSIDVECTDEMLRSFDVYYNELIEWNNRFNLTAITSREEVVLKHFIDSITAVKYIKSGNRVIDIGSGAGFPAIPLKIVKPDIDITMLDSLNKRVTFLEHMIEILKLGDARAIHARAEDLAGGKMREAYDIVIARAVARLDTLLEYTLPYIKVGGKFIAYKSIDSEEEIKEAANALYKLKGKIIKVDEFNLPKSVINRTLIIIEKIGKTPEMYPRDKNLPKKNAL